MPRKRNPDISHSDKLIKLFAALFFRKGSRSLSQLADELGCSKQGVQRLVEKIETGYGVRVSMDGCGRWMDNVFIERLWRSLKYECVCLNDMGFTYQPEPELSIELDADFQLVGVVDGPAGESRATLWAKKRDLGPVFRSRG